MKVRKITLIFLILTLYFLYYASFLQAIYGQDIILKRTIMDAFAIKVTKI